jgi:hypothetical protein
MKKEFFRQRTSAKGKSGDSLGEFEVFDFDWNTFKSKTLAEAFVKKFVDQETHRIARECAENGNDASNPTQLHTIDSFLIRLTAPNETEISEFVNSRKNFLGSIKPLKIGVTSSQIAALLVKLFISWTKEADLNKKYDNEILDRIKELENGIETHITNWLLEKLAENRTRPNLFLDSLSI